MSGSSVPKRDRLAMTGTGHPEVIIDAEVVDDAPSASFALVPLSARADVRPKASPSRPDASFVAQLIATAERAPQTRGLRRASLADAQTAYGASQIRRSGTGFRTRQTI